MSLDEDDEMILIARNRLAELGSLRAELPRLRRELENAREAHRIQVEAYEKTYADMEQDRDHWLRDAREAHRQADTLRAEVARLTAALDAERAARERRAR